MPQSDQALHCTNAPTCLSENLGSSVYCMLQTDYSSDTGIPLTDIEEEDQVYWEYTVGK